MMKFGTPDGGRRTRQGVDEARVRAGGGAVGVAQPGAALAGTAVLAARPALHARGDPLHALGAAARTCCRCRCAPGGRRRWSAGPARASRPGWSRRAWSRWPAASWCCGLAAAAGSGVAARLPGGATGWGAGAGLDGASVAGAVADAGCVTGDRRRAATGTVRLGLSGRRGSVSAVSRAATTVAMTAAASAAASRGSRAGRERRAWRASGRGLVFCSAKPNRGSDRHPRPHAAARAEDARSTSSIDRPARELQSLRRAPGAVQDDMHDLTLKSRVRSCFRGDPRETIGYPARRWPPPSTTRASSTASPGRARRPSGRSPRS